MEISALTGTTPNSAAESSRIGLADNLDAFLQMLITQLQYQDPLSPTDPTQFTEQLVQFSQVEQTIATNDNLETLIAVSSSNQAVGAIGLLGNEVQVTGSVGMLQGGKAVFGYALEVNAASSEIRIVDSSGTLVRNVPSALSAGIHEFVWDGKDNTGNDLPDGVYSISVAATDGEQNPVNVATSFTGVVSGVQNANGSVLLSFGELLVPIEEIVSIVDPAAL